MVAAGLEIAGRRPVLIFQDNGIGNLPDCLVDFSAGLPCSALRIVSRRGGLGEHNSMIHTISERSEALLDAANVRRFQLDARTPASNRGYPRSIAPGRSRAPRTGPCWSWSTDGRLIDVAAVESRRGSRRYDAEFPQSPMILTLGARRGKCRLLPVESRTTCQSGRDGPNGVHRSRALHWDCGR